ncbi:hypothetical protein PV08_06872 [Exophiala spinifera]|uniref:Aminoglycoside phosphotransferase domain-containing protein n=1 Tax=Exophiala spinifera TaxID=91928 RepID=A0A0D1YGH1_9EURO|nr:uncharacterized protein PV08_06872 [Exophiala spinifera]KIW14091.1 hypothetical protein PV08_06872 [Exophiala spinifera]
MSSYSPRLNVMHVRQNIGWWDLGSHWVLRDYPDDDTAGNEYMTHVYLREQLGDKIPLVKEMHLFPAGSVNFTVESRAQGKQLMEVWESLSPQQIANYQDQMVDILKHMRQLTAPRPQKVNGDRLGNCLTGITMKGHAPWCLDIGYTNEEWMEILAGDIRYNLARKLKIDDPKVLEEKFQEIKDSVPDGAPYVMTHADLNLTNIIVKDDKIEAIIDWEMAGFYPWWAEVFRVGRSYPPAEEFFNGVFERVDPKLREDYWVPKVFGWKFFQTMGYYHHADHEPSDPDAHTGGYFRGPFCKCHPDPGWIDPVAVGVKFKHIAWDWRKLMKKTSEEGN